MVWFFTIFTIMSMRGGFSSKRSLLWLLSGQTCSKGRDHLVVECPLVVIFILFSCIVFVQFFLWYNEKKRWGVPLLTSVKKSSVTWIYLELKSIYDNDAIYAITTPLLIIMFSWPKPTSRRSFMRLFVASTCFVCLCP